jgi:transposase
MTTDRTVAVLLEKYGRPYAEEAGIRLADKPGLLIDRWHGDLRHLRDEAGGEPQTGVARLLTEFPGIGPAGASIFLREVQGVWPEVAPYVDALVMKGAGKVGLPVQPAALKNTLSASGEPARLAAALVRVALSGRAAGEVTAAMSGQGAR